MKKLMIAVAAMAVGLVANAGAVSWTFNGVAGSTSNPLSAKDQYVAYLFIADATTAVDSSVYSSVLTQLTEKGKDADLSKFTYYTAKNTMFGGKAKFSSNNGSYTGSADALTYVSAFAVIIDADSLVNAKNYMIAKTTTTTYSSDGIMMTQGFGEQGDKVFSWGNQSTSGASWTAMPSGSSVPEPTSGMLLMFGLATLALRRRRA